MMKDVTMELAQILMVKVCHQGVVIFSKIPPLTLLPLASIGRPGQRKRNKNVRNRRNCALVPLLKVSWPVVWFIFEIVSLETV